MVTGVMFGKVSVLVGDHLPDNSSSRTGSTCGEFFVPKTDADTKVGHLKTYDVRCVRRVIGDVVIVTSSDINYHQMRLCDITVS